MKTLLMVLGIGLVVAPVLAQEEEGDWKIMPSVSFVKFFPGERHYRYDYIPLAYPGPDLFYVSPYKYSGSGLNFSARCFNGDFKPIVFTFGAGVNWYYQPKEEAVFSPMSMKGSVGRSFRGGDFTAFPLSVGVQAVYPYDSPEKLMLFGGVEGNLQLISGNIDVDDQAKAGYSLVGGFAVKVFEFGVRYTSFSDMNNLGVQFGLRFKSFSF